MRLKIVSVGDPVLRKRARPLTPDEISRSLIQDFIGHLRDTMHDAPGVGLAAPQVGFSLQIAVIEDREEFLKDIAPEQLKERDRHPVPFQVIINPRVTEASQETVEFFEGCLSLAGFSAVVPRARTVCVECLDEKGEQRAIRASGWYARILQHEIDHLNGAVYIDRMHSRTFTTLEHWNRFWKNRPTADNTEGDS